MPVRTVTLLALALAALALPACGGEEPPLVQVRGTEVEITLDDFLIRPQRLAVRPGERLTVSVTNRGRLGHTLRLRARDRNVLAFTTIKPGETKRRTVRLGRGTYTMYCALANHEELGMYGTLTVK